MKKQMKVHEKVIYGSYVKCLSSRNSLKRLMRTLKGKEVTGALSFHFVLYINNCISQK